jgi:hypothetical protein
LTLARLSGLEKVARVHSIIFQVHSFFFFGGIQHFDVIIIILFVAVTALTFLLLQLSTNSFPVLAAAPVLPRCHIDGIDAAVRCSVTFLHVLLLAIRQLFRDFQLVHGLFPSRC